MHHKIKSDIKQMIIVYEDDHLLVINKPKNLLVHATAHQKDHTLFDLIKDRVKLQEFDDQTRAGVIHRLDQNTTGLMVIAKTANVALALIKQINNQTMIRKYLALCLNNFKHKKLVCKLPLIRSSKQTTKMVVSDDVNAKEAISIFSLIENFKQYCLLECELKTGRTHQLRAHLSYLHHYIYNDPLYGKKVLSNHYDQFLHAHYLLFVHPISNEVLTFESDVDDFFDQQIKKLKQE